MQQMLKEMLQGAQAKPLGEGDLASLLTSRTEPHGDGEGRIFPDTFQDAAHKPSSHHRGRNKATGYKKPREPSNTMQQMLKEMQQGGQEKDQKAVLKAVFPRENSGSWSASAAGREAMPGTVSEDWDRDMEYMEMLVSGGLKTLPDTGGPPAWTNQDIEDGKSLEASRLLDKMLSDLETHRDEGAETASPAAGMEDGLEPLGGSAGVSAERTFPATFLIPERKLGSHRRGPPRGRNKPTEDIKSLETSEYMDVRLSDRDRRHEMDQKSLQKAELPAECNSFIPDASTEREEIADSGTEGIDIKDSAPISGIVRPQDVRKTCVVDSVVTVITVQLAFICCFFGIRKVYKIRRNTSATPASWRRMCHSPSSTGSLETVWFYCAPKRSQKQDLPCKEEHQHSRPPPQSPSPAVIPISPEIPPPPPLPSQPPWSS
ncbi:uncharacterized protein LOC111944786 [Cyanistes caeruleus]|uniref:uncharacterized protein LOC111944786 n=1 Tax=Cyanistes caeruleus TaxID=156563 RepID=UPI000CDA3DA7|nr:uncharacterized protein LOC111944786 [Cyanistes caeruleus]